MKANGERGRVYNQQNPPGTALNSGCLNYSHTSHMEAFHKHTPRGPRSTTPSYMATRKHTATITQRPEKHDL